MTNTAFVFHSILILCDLIWKIAHSQYIYVTIYSSNSEFQFPVLILYNVDNSERFKSFLEPRWDYLSSNGDGDQSPRQRHPHPKIPPEREHGTRSRKLWISMGLCYSENTRLFMKSSYPYAEVTPLAVILWRHFSPDAGVLVRIIYTGRNKATKNP